MKWTLLPLALFATACGPKVDLGPLPPPPERLVCQELPARPDLAPLTPFALPDGTLAYRKADVDTRDGAIARYIVAMQGAYFDCRSDVEWNADYWREVER